MTAGLITLVWVLAQAPVEPPVALPDVELDALTTSSFRPFASVGANVRVNGGPGVDIVLELGELFALKPWLDVRLLTTTFFHVPGAIGSPAQFSGVSAGVGAVFWVGYFGFGPTVQLGWWEYADGSDKQESHPSLLIGPMMLVMASHRVRFPGRVAQEVSLEAGVDAIGQQRPTIGPPTFLARIAYTVSLGGDESVDDEAAMTSFVRRSAFGLGGGAGVTQMEAFTARSFWVPQLIAAANLEFFGSFAVTPRLEFQPYLGLVIGGDVARSLLLVQGMAGLRANVWLTSFFGLGLGVQGGFAWNGSTRGLPSLTHAPEFAAIAYPGQVRFGERGRHRLGLGVGASLVWIPNRYLSDGTVALPHLLARLTWSTLF